MSDVTVVIGNFEGALLLGDCLESLSKQTLPPSEVIVVDGSSRDESLAVAESLGARVISTENRGLGFLYNTGARATKSGYVFLANNDIALDERCLETLAGALDEDSARFAADARQFDWEGERVVHARTTLRRGRMSGEYLPGLHLDHLVESDVTARTVCANGAAMLVRRQMMLDLGGFDETFFMEWEDLDLCWRGWLRGWPTVYAPAAVVRHRVGAVTTQSVMPRRLASSHHNLVRFALKCLPVDAATRVILGELLRLPRHPAAIARGLAAVLLELPAILRLRRERQPRRAVFSAMLEGRPA
jgi:GT2 family glycosyltransferase